MSFLNRFIKGVSDAPSFGSAASRGLRKRDASPPNTMVGWKSYVDELPRSERSRQYPGMHKDLIPTFEMITDGDSNWGMERSSSPGMSFAAKAARSSKQRELERLRGELEAYKDVIDDTQLKIVRWKKNLKGLRGQYDYLGITKEMRIEVGAKIRRKEVELKQLEEQKKILYDDYNRLSDKIKKLEEDIRNGVGNADGGGPWI